MGVTAQQVMAPVVALAGEDEAKVGSNNTTINRYFGAVGAAYCGYTLLYAFAKAGSTLLNGSGAANVGNLARFCEAKGWRVSSPQPGDIFVMRSGGYENGHTGFVWLVLGNGYFITLEGNYGSVKATPEDAINGTGVTYEGIGFRKAPINSTYKFYRPTYDGATPAPLPGPSIDEGKVKEWQTWLGAKPDGDPGAETELAAIKKMLLAMLTKYPLGPGSTGDAVKDLQGMLYAAGYDPKGLDGIYGTGCTEAVRKFEREHNQSPDGGAGVKVVTALLDEVF